MKINRLVEHEDGTATAEVDLTTEEVQACIQFALTQAIKNAIANKADSVDLDSIERDDTYTPDEEVPF